MIAWFLSLLVSVAFAAPAPGDEAADQAFQTAVKLLAQRYPDAMATGAFHRAAIDGMAAEVDAVAKTRGSGVLTVAEYTELQNRQRGERAGVGVQFGVLVGQGLIVDRVYPGSSAEKAGIQHGDWVVGVNDHPFIGQDAPTILGLVQRVGPPRVLLDVRRQGGPVRTVPVAWGTYWLDAVAPCGDGSVQCLEIQQFGAGTSAALARALQEMDPSQGVLLDLRTNEGGLIEEMVSAADLFLAAGEVVVITQGPEGSTQSLSASTARAWDGRVVLVVDDGTRGLAEAFAATLKEHLGARLVGTRTAGEGTTDSFYPLGAELVLRLADVRLRSPSGRSWAPEGLAPDLMVQHPEMVLPPDSTGAIPDIQLDAGIRLLRGR